MTATPDLQLRRYPGPLGWELHDPSGPSSFFLGQEVTVHEGPPRSWEGRVVSFVFGPTTPRGQEPAVGWSLMVEESGQEPTVVRWYDATPIADRRPEPPVSAEHLQRTGGNIDAWDTVSPTYLTRSGTASKVDLYHGGHQHPMTIKLGQLCTPRPDHRPHHGPVNFFQVDAIGHVFEVIQIEPQPEDGIVLLVRDRTAEAGNRPTDPVDTYLADPRDLLWGKAEEA